MGSGQLASNWPIGEVPHFGPTSLVNPILVFIIKSRMPNRRVPTPVAVAAYSKGLTRAEIAQAYGCHKSFIDNVFADRANPPLRLQEKLEEMTGLSRAELFPHLYDHELVPS